jgi:hypothetical protein
MTDYPLDMQLVVDPLNPQNVVRNGSVYIYDPADTAGTSPIALKDPSGMPLPQPLQSNDFGFIPPTIVTIPRVKWKSGDFEGFFYSYDGLRNEAVAAREAAEAVELFAQAPTDAQVDAGIIRADVTGRVNAQVPPLVQAQVAPLVASQVPPLVASTIASNPTVANSAASMAQSTAGLVPVWKANESVTAGQRRIAPSGDIVSAKTTFTTGATYDGTKWDSSAQDGRLGAVEAKQLVKCVRLESGKWVWDTVAGTHYVIPDAGGAFVVRATAQPIPTATPSLDW